MIFIFFPWDLGLGTWDLNFGTWDLNFGTWIFLDASSPFDYIYV